jgi:hypothetical protein
MTSRSRAPTTSGWWRPACSAKTRSSGWRWLHLTAGQVLLAVEVRRLHQGQVAAAQHVQQAVAPRGVHGHRGGAVGQRVAHVLEDDGPAADPDAPVALQPADVGARHARGGQPVGVHAAAPGLAHRVAERRHPVAQRDGLEHHTAAERHDRRLVVGQGDPPHLDRHVAQADAEQAVDLAGRRARVDQHDGPAALLEGHAQDDAGQPQGVVAVLVGEQHVRHPRRPLAGQQQLALGALAGVDQQPEPSPPEQVAVGGALPRRRLARGAEHHQLPRPHLAAGRRRGHHGTLPLAAHPASASG